MSTYDAMAYYKKKLSNQTEENENFAQTSQLKGYDAMRYYRAKSLGLDTFKTDLNSIAKTVDNAFGGWQSVETMKNIRDSVLSMYNRINSYNNYQKEYGGVDLTDLAKTYETALKILDEKAKKYSKYKTKTEYDTAVEEEKERYEKNNRPIEDYDWEIKRVKESIDDAGVVDTVMSYLGKNGVTNARERLGTLEEDRRLALEYQTQNKSLDELNTEIADLEKKLKKAKGYGTPAGETIASVDVIKEGTKKGTFNTQILYDDYMKKIGFSSVDEIQEKIDTLKSIKKSKEQYEILNEAQNAKKENEEEYEKYVEKGKQILADEGEWSRFGNAAIFRDEAYAYLQNEFAPGMVNWGNALYGSGEYMEKSEKEDLLYHIGKDGEIAGEEAEKYLEVLNPILAEREATEFYEENLKDNEVLEMLYFIPDGLNQVTSGIDGLLSGGEIAPSATQMAGAKAREDLGDGVAGFIYDAGKTVTAMVPSIAVGAAATYVNPALGSWVASGMQGASAMGNARQSALRSGMDEDSAWVYATLVGVSETALSKIGSKVFGGKIISGKVQTAINGIENNFLRFATNVGVAAVSEGLEEAAQEVLEPLFENIALGYNKNGFEDIDWGEVAYSGLLGALSGGTFDMAGVGIDSIKNGVQAAGIYDTASKKAELLDFALSLPQDSNAYKLAQKYKGGKLSNGKIYNLMTASENYIADQYLQQGERNNVLERARATLKKQTGIKLSVGEIELLSKSSLGQQVLKGNWKVTTENSLQPNTQNGIMNQGGEQNGRISNQRAIGRGIQEKMDSGRKSQMGKSDETIGGYVQGGKAEVLSGGSGEAQRRIRINHTQNSSVSFTEGKADNTNGYKAYLAFANAGMKVIYCDGPIERTVNGVTVTRTEAFTAPDGTVYVSSESSLPPKQTFDHEKVHVAQKTNNPAYTEYESALCESAIYYSSTYFGLAEDINKYQLNNKYDIEDISTSSVFMREIAAYINQFVLSDPAFAEQTFGGMFSDWGAVVQAVNKFNTDMGADFTESANFMPEGENTSDTGDTSGIEILSISRKNVKRRHTTQKEQNFIKRVAKALGVKVEFTEITADLLRSYGYDFKDGDILPDGFYDRNTKTVHIGYTVYNPVTFILKHELTHFGEGTAQYKKFVEIAKKSKAFRNWLETQTRAQSKHDVKDLENAYLIKIARERGYKLQKDGVLSESDRNELHCEMIADFVGDCIFSGDIKKLENMLSGLDYKEKNIVVRYILDFISYLKKKLAGNKEIVLEISRLEDAFNRMLSEAVDTNKETPTESGGDLQFSVKTDSIGKYVEVDVAQDVYDGKSLKEMQSIARKIICDKFKGKILTADDNSKVFINKRSSEEYAYPANRRMNDTVKEAKMRTAPELDNLLSVSKFIENRADDGRHPEATGGWDIYSTRFKVGGIMFVGEVQVMVTQRGSVFYDVTKIKGLPVNGGQTDNTSAAASGNPSIDIIDEKTSAVNSKYMQESGNNSKNNLQFSFARVQDEKLISKAEAMEKRLKNEGKVADIIRIRIWNKYGIIRDSAGEWIYEIDDSEMEFFHLGNAVTENPEIMELYELENAKRLSKEKGERLNSLRKKYGYSILRSGKLSDFVKHPKLFKAFPQLKDINFRVLILKDNEKGFYDKNSNTIGLDLKVLIDIQEIESGRKRIKDFKKNPYILAKKYIIHEIQHALQRLEDREPGASPEYWSKRFEREGKEKNQPDIGRISSPYDAYWQTKGEYEARVVSERLEMTEEQRHGKGSTPWLGWNETISARETVTANSSNASIPTNAEYMSAIKDGDTKQIQKMVDNVAKAHGYSERLYHQTGADFTEFNTDNEVAGKFDWEVPTGIFLKPSNTDIGLKGKKQMALFAKAENPLHFKDRAEAREFWSENIDGYRQAAEEVERIDNEYREKDDDAIMELQSYMRQWKKENPNADKRDIYTDTKYQKLADKESTIMDEWEAKSDKASIKAKRLINDFMAESGYDGIVIEHDADGKNRYTKSYIVFDSSQLKSAEPIVYDDKGNVIQLSERFDQNKKDIRFSVPSVDSYTEEQYNSFGWVRANNVLSASEYKTLLSRYADYKHNKDKYPTTRFGEAVIHSFDHPSVIMYVKGTIENPDITKVVRIVKGDSFDISMIQERIIKNEHQRKPLPYETIGKMYGEEYLRLDNRRNNASFRQYTAQQEGRGSQEGDTVSRSEQDGTGSQKQNNATSEAGLKKPAFSMPSETRMLLDMYENGEISKTEYQTALDKYWDDTIAELGDSAWAEQLRLIKDNIKLHGRIKRQNEQLARRRAEISQEITAQREERATKQKNIEHIRKTVSRIDKMLRTNSNTKHVPEELKAEITQFVSVFVANDRSPFDKKDLRNIYLTYSDALRESSAEEMLTGLDEDVLRDLKILRDRLDGKTLRDLNYPETLLVRNIVDNFAQIIKWGNEMFLAGKEYEYNVVGRQAMHELTAKKSKRENSFSKAIDCGIVYANMTPAYFFDELGGVFKTLYDDVVEAQNKWYRNIENAKTYIRQLKEKYHYSEWENDMFEFTTEKGDKIKISREQAMLLYATAKREYGNNFQKAEHLFRGGVVIEPSPKKLNDVVKRFKASDEKGRKRIAEAFSEEVDSRAHRITPDDVLNVKLWLTDEQLKYVDDFVEYLSKDMAALGNEISMLLYGIRKYNENYYIPYNSAQNFLYSQPGVSNETRLKHQSFTKNTVVGANNPLVLSDFSDVCADHINRMCMYNALTMPLENMNKIFNFKTTPGGDFDVRSVQSELERAYGESAVSYIKTFIEDMNGNVRISQADKAINRWISKFKKGAVFASASVVVQQPSAIIRAMAYIKPKYFTKTALKFAERDYQQCIKYAPVAGIKEMGRFDTGVGAATTNWLLQETPHGIKNKVKALFSKDSTYRDDKMSYFAAKADEITWAHIWAAVKAEIADTTDLSVGSEEFFNACGKRFTEVINYTQVYDSTLSRSQMMRSKSTGAQMLTAFMSEPTVSLNLLMNAARKAKSGTKEGRYYAARAVAAFAGSVALNAFLKSFVTAARDDDDEETYLEKYTGEFLSNFLSDVNPFGLIPFVKDVISIFEGYTVERADMNLFSDLAQSFKTFSSDTKSGYEKFESIAGSLAAFLGLPVKNVLRDLRAVYNLCNDIFVTDKVDRAVDEEVEGYMDELSDNETYEALDEEDKEKLEKRINDTVCEVKEAENDKSQREEFDELYALLRKSKSAYNKRRKELLEKGYTASEITDGVEIARIAYMKSIGVDVGDYLLYKIATSKKYADTDNSGGVTKKEKQAAVREMDIDEKIKNYFLKQHK